MFRARAEFLSQSIPQFVSVKLRLSSPSRWRPFVTPTWWWQASQTRPPSTRTISATWPWICWAPSTTLKTPPPEITSRSESVSGASQMAEQGRAGFRPKGTATHQHLWTDRNSVSRRDFLMWQGVAASPTANIDGEDGNEFPNMCYISFQFYIPKRVENHPINPNSTGNLDIGII